MDAVAEPEPVAELRRALGGQLATFRQAADLTQGQLAKIVFCDRTTIVHLEKGRTSADERFWQAVDDACAASGALLAVYLTLEAAKNDHKERERERRLAAARERAAAFRVQGVGHLIRRSAIENSTTSEQATPSSIDDEAAALELSRRVAASDVGEETLTQLELAFDELAMTYPFSPPELPQRLRKHLSYVANLIDVRKTLAEHRRLVVVGAWLSLLAATVHIDLRQPAAATARLRTADSMARHAGHDEIRAWCSETAAWRWLTEGDYHRALTLCQKAQELAPAGTSAAIQAAAQEGRAWARLGQSRESRAAIERVTKLAASLPRPERAEHHYQYDPDKSVAYVATTLAWLNDPAAESYAREIIARLQPGEDAGKWPRRVATAHLDLALTLITSNQLDEACDAAERAITSDRLAPSSYWRAAEVVRAVSARKLPEACELRAAYEAMTSRNRTGAL